MTAGLKLNLKPYTVHPPEAFKPESQIGEAYAAKVAAQAAFDDLDKQLADAQRERSELGASIKVAGLNVDRAHFGEQRDRAFLLDAHIPILTDLRAKAFSEAQKAAELFNQQYGQYAGFVQYYDVLITPPFGALGRMNVSEWWHVLENQRANIENYEKQLQEATK